MKIHISLSYSELSEEEQIKKVQNRWTSIKDIEKPSEKVQLAAVKNNSLAIKYIKDPSMKVQLAAVKNDGESIRFIENPSEEVQLIAVKNTGYSIGYIKNPSKAVQLAAVKKDGESIRSIENPSEDLQLIAVNNNWIAIKYIENPSEKVQLAAVKNHDRVIQYIKDPSEKVQLAAVKKDVLAIKSIKNPSSKVEVYVKKTHKIEEHKGNHTNLTEYPNLDQDQIAVIRYMDLNNKQEITVKELKTEFNNSPTIQALIKLRQGKPINKKQILAFTLMLSEDKIVEQIKKYSDLELTTPWDGVQVIFKGTENKVKVLTMKRDILLPLIKAKDVVLLDAYIKDSNHPHSLFKNTVTLSWIRFTVFNKDVWIDEIQTDLPKILKNTEINWMKFLPELILKQFIKFMRSKGYEKFYIPSHDMKLKLYKANPPISIYKDLPKKMRFKQEKATNIDKKINGKMIWSLASVEVKDQ